MRLDYILEGIDTAGIHGDTGIDITDITTDSRQCRPGCLFIAVPGFESDGHSYIGKAIEAGASAVMYQHPEAAGEIIGSGITAVRVGDTRGAVPDAAGNFFGHPSADINLIGVTGTNGKTTIATLLYRLFSGLGYCCGLLSTIANYVCGERFETTNTTQDPITLNRLLRLMCDRGCQYCCEKYVKLLQDNGMMISMTECGNPRENAIAERVNGILKSEWLNDERFSGISDARIRIAEIIDIYNNKRPHLSLGYATPAQASLMVGEQTRKWKNYYKTKESPEKTEEIILSLTSDVRTNLQTSGL